MKYRFILFVFCVIFLSCQASSTSSTPYSEPIQNLGKTYWWNDVVFYEIFVRSFYDSDGDGIGDIQGIISKLDYLNDGNPETTSDLGIGGIWLMPVAQSPSYHGYDVTNYNEIESDYGTNADFQQLMIECHERGIKVIVDYVMNHTSNQHPWFIASASNEPEYTDWYLWSENNPGNTQPWGGSYPVWHQHDNGKFYYGVFWGGMPDLNYNNSEVKDEMFDIADFWLTDMNADGFRCDAVKYIYEEEDNLENLPATYAFWSEFNEHYKSINPDAMAVGEAWDATEIILNYLDGKFDFCFEFELASAIIAGVNEHSPNYIRSKMSSIKSLYPYHQYGTFLTNHDQNRIFPMVGQNIAANKLAASVYLTLPGIPFIYYGEEIGMLGSKPDENIRRPMQWNANINAGFTSGNPWHQINSNYNDFNVQEEMLDPNSIWNQYNMMIQLRNSEPALTKGTYQAIDAENGHIYAYLRNYLGENLIVIHNFATTSMPIILNANKTNIEPGNYNLIDLTDNIENISQIVIGSDGMIEDWEMNWELEARTTVILKLINP